MRYVGSENTFGQRMIDNFEYDEFETKALKEITRLKKENAALKGMSKGFDFISRCMLFFAGCMAAPIIVAMCFKAAATIGYPHPFVAVSILFFSVITGALAVLSLRYGG